jgi:hypothetical protein
MTQAMRDIGMAVNAYTTKDSGNKVGFATGAVRNKSSGKGRYDLLPCAAIRRLAGVLERGADIYAARNWEKGMSMSRCMESALRHSFQHLEGHRDEDHLAQAVFNLMAVIEFEERIKRGTLPADLNDLPTPLPNEEKSLG